MDDLQRSGRPRVSGAMQAPPARTPGRATQTTGSTLKACCGTRRTSILRALENLGRWSLAWLEISHQPHESFVLMILTGSDQLGTRIRRSVSPAIPLSLPS